MTGLTIWHIIAAIGIGVVLSFGLSAINSPRLVEVHPVEIAPVPTPEPVYIKNSEPAGGVNYGQVIDSEQVFDVNYGQIINGRYPINNYGQCINCR